jgi:hypothetical protein
MTTLYLSVHRVSGLVFQVQHVSRSDLRPPRYIQHAILHEGRQICCSSVRDIGCHKAPASSRSRQRAIHQLLAFEFRVDIDRLASS